MPGLRHVQSEAAVHGRDETACAGVPVLFWKSLLFYDTVHQEIGKDVGVLVRPGLHAQTLISTCFISNACATVDEAVTMEWHN